MTRPPLSEEQHDFVHAGPDQHQSLQSWAGTGKTHTLTERVARLVEVHGVAPENIVITTFTVEGARECAERLAHRLGPGGQGLRVGTMDGLASRWMREHFNPTDHYTGVQEYGPLLLDFLQGDGGRDITDGVKYLVVDEFQDLSQTQLDTVLAFYRAGSMILAIGDVAQNIYEWRGCHGRFLRDLPHNIHGMREFQLTANRRCTPEIIAVGNACLKFLHPPHTSMKLMRPVRPSLGLVPSLEALAPREALGANVTRLLKFYHHVCGVPYGDIAVLSRYKRSLFLVEEALLKANLRTSQATNQGSVPFVTSACVGEADSSPRRKPGHATLMTLHQSKGLEWPCVILVLWDPREAEEEWRLMYVAVTRARDRLHVLAPSEGTKDAFLFRLGCDKPGLFCTPFGQPVSPPDALPSADSDSAEDSAEETTLGVVEAVRALTGRQIHEMRRRRLIPVTRGSLRAAPGCRMRVYRFVPSSKTFAESDGDGSGGVKEPTKDEAGAGIDACGFHVELGNFVDRHVARRLAFLPAAGRTTANDLPTPRTPEPTTMTVIRDRDSESLLHTVYLPRCEARVMSKYRALLELARGSTKADALHALAEQTDVTKADLLLMSRALDRIASHARVTRLAPETLRTAAGRAPMTMRELAQLRTAYERFCDQSRETCYYATFRVALAATALHGRKSAWYHSDAYKWFRWSLRALEPCIERFIADVRARAETIAVKPSYVHRGLAGEADAVTDAEVIEVKCSTRSHDFAWFGQGLAYLALASANDARKNALRIFNPMTQTVWSFECAGWSHDARAGFLDFLAHGEVQHLQ